MRKWLSALSLPLDRSHLSADLTAGLTFAVVNVPQAMANAVLATVNPVCGLYTLMVATPVGALFTSSVFMNVSTTGALSVAAGDALAYIPAEQKLAALVTLAVLIGLFQLAFGLLRMGTLIRFVSHSVMTGFVSGIALLIVLGAISDLTGYTSPYARHLFRLADTVLNLNRMDPATLGLGLSTIALIVGFGYTRAKKFALILALGVVTLASVILSVAFGVDSVTLVRDIADIPRSLPSPMLPDLSLLPALLLPALAIGVVGLVQGAGVGQSYPNPDGRYPDASRDFTGQGLGNIAAGLFQGIPGGGSMSGTAVTVNAGARSRWANISAGVFVVLIVFLLVDLVKLIPMAALGGLLVVVGIQNLQPEQIATVWRTNRVARTGMVLTLGGHADHAAAVRDPGGGGHLDPAPRLPLLEPDQDRGDRPRRGRLPPGAARAGPPALRRGDRAARLRQPLLRGRVGVREGPALRGRRPRGGGGPHRAGAARDRQHADRSPAPLRRGPRVARRQADAGRGLSRALRPARAHGHGQASSAKRTSSAASPSSGRP